MKFDIILAVDVNHDRINNLPSITFLDQVGEVALATVVAVEVHGHEDTRSAKLVWALATQACNLVLEPACTPQSGKGKNSKKNKHITENTKKL